MGIAINSMQVESSIRECRTNAVREAVALLAAKYKFSEEEALNYLMASPTLAVWCNDGKSIAWMRGNEAVPYWHEDGELVEEGDYTVVEYRCGEHKEKLRRLREEPNGTGDQGIYFYQNRGGRLWKKIGIIVYRGPIQEGTVKLYIKKEGLEAEATSKYDCLQQLNYEWPGGFEQKCWARSKGVSNITPINL
tara:strand:- start:74 stop:649 length:576 start_codon:yes stop_codon:yes gene_type:complete